MVSAETDCLLKLSNSDYLLKFLHETVDNLIGRKCTENEGYSGDIELTASDTQRARSVIQSLYKKALTEGKFEPQIAGLNENDLKIVKECFEIRQKDVYHAVLREKLLSSGHPLVENIDWKLKWIMGSSKMASISEPLLQIDLQCYQKGTVNFEMNLEQLDKLIDQLEIVKKNLQ